MSWEIYKIKNLHLLGIPKNVPFSLQSESISIDFSFSSSFSNFRLFDEQFVSASDWLLEVYNYLY